MKFDKDKQKEMKLTIVCVFYPPINSSAAIQVNNLVDELANQGHSIEVITPDNSIKDSITYEKKKNIRILRFKNGKMTDISLFKRALNEFFMPFRIILTILNKSVNIQKSDGIIWWSPSIFFSPLVIFLKLKNKCRCYLILRDIFPKWAKDLKLIKNIFVYSFFNIFFNLQCLVADYIGVQAEGNKKFIPKNYFVKKTTIEVLNNWYTPNLRNNECEIDLSKTILKKKKVFIHAGNIGIAQGFNTIIKVAEKLKDNKNIGFLFIGRGSKFEMMKKLSKEKKLTNILFHNQISNSQIINLYKQCSYGLVLLDKRHTTHNIPGKMISYLHSGLPIFAIVNRNNNLISFVNKNNIGFASFSFNENYLKNKIINLSNINFKDIELNNRCREIANKYFNTKKIAEQIIRRF